MPMLGQVRFILVVFPNTSLAPVESNDVCSSWLGYNAYE